MLLKGLGIRIVCTQVAALKDTPASPRADLPPLEGKQPSLLAPALRGSRKQQEQRVTVDTSQALSARQTSPGQRGGGPGRGMCALWVKHACTQNACKRPAGGACAHTCMARCSLGVVLMPLLLDVLQGDKRMGRRACRGPSQPSSCWELLQTWRTSSGCARRACCCMGMRVRLAGWCACHCRWSVQVGACSSMELCK